MVDVVVGLTGEGMEGYYGDVSVPQPITVNVTGEEATTAMTGVTVSVHMFVFAEGLEATGIFGDVSLNISQAFEVTGAQLQTGSGGGDAIIFSWEKINTQYGIWTPV